MVAEHQLAILHMHCRESGLVWLCFPTRCGCTDCTKFLGSFAQLLVHFVFKERKFKPHVVARSTHLFDINMFEVFQIFNFRFSCTGRLPNTSASRNICGNVSTSAGSNAGACKAQRASKFQKLLHCYIDLQIARNGTDVSQDFCLWRW